VGYRRASVEYSANVLKPQTLRCQLRVHTLGLSHSCEKELGCPQRKAASVYHTSSRVVSLHSRCSGLRLRNDHVLFLKAAFQDEFTEVDGKLTSSRPFLEQAEQVRVFSTQRHDHGVNRNRVWVAEGPGLVTY
jgi:hypothetical protein